MNKNSKKVGRKTKLTPELQQVLCDIFKDGNFVSTACNAVGIGTPFLQEQHQAAP